MDAMPVVTAMEVHHRDKERVKLFLDDEYAIDLPLMQAARLSPGQQLTPAEVAELSDAGAQHAAFDRAFRFLAHRPRSIDEVRRHLVKKEVPDSQIAVVIDGLLQRGYVDDLEFARYWISNRDRFKPMGSRALRYELRQKGVDDEIIKRLLAEVDEDDSAYRAALARMSRYRGFTRQAFRQKLSALLRRRGFHEHAINDAVLRLQALLESSEPDYFCYSEQD
jgi:regulatory protein